MEEEEEKHCSVLSLALGGQIITDRRKQKPSFLEWGVVLFRLFTYSVRIHLSFPGAVRSPMVSNQSWLAYQWQYQLAVCEGKWNGGSGALKTCAYKVNSSYSKPCTHGRPTGYDSPSKK
jgi:hypothetical protein